MMCIRLWLLSSSLEKREATRTQSAAPKNACVVEKILIKSTRTRRQQRRERLIVVCVLHCAATNGISVYTSRLLLLYISFSTVAFEDGKIMGACARFATISTMQICRRAHKKSVIQRRAFLRAIISSNEECCSRSEIA